MPDMPSAFYIPAFGALLAALAFVAGIGGKIAEKLYQRNVVLSDKGYAAAEAQTTGALKMASSLDANTALIQQLTVLVREIQNAILRTTVDLEDDPPGGPARRRPPR